MSSSPEELTAELLSRTRQLPIADVDGLLSTATSSIVDLGVADYVSILERVGDHEFTTRAPTDEHATTVDSLQRQLHQGPCVEASYDADLVVSTDVSMDPRWPQWGPAAAEAGVRAVISVQLYQHEDTMGALNLFFADPQNFTADDLDRARALAVPISIELAHGREHDNLWKAVQTRTLIGQAQGILMERFKISPASAFGTLRRLSQDSNTKLVAIAEQIVQTGQLPDTVTGPDSGQVRD